MDDRFWEQQLLAADERSRRMAARFAVNVAQGSGAFGLRWRLGCLVSRSLAWCSGRRREQRPRQCHFRVSSSRGCITRCTAG